VVVEMPHPDKLTVDPGSKPDPVTVQPEVEQPPPGAVPSTGPGDPYANAAVDAPKTRPSDNSPPAINFIAR
jgi:hypothetical protein